MVEVSSLEIRLRVINTGCPLAMALYLYSNSAYSTIYGIIRPYQNYLNWPKTLALWHTQFNKAISWLRIKVEHGFAIYYNL